MSSKVISRATRIRARAIFLGIKVEELDKGAIRKAVSTKLQHKPWTEFLRTVNPEEKARYMEVQRQLGSQARIQAKEKNANLAKQGEEQRRLRKLDRYNSYIKHYQTKVSQLQKSVA